MANVTMPNGDIVAFPDDMPREQIKALISKKFPDAEREAKARTGALPYQNVAEVAGTVLSNLPANWSRESNAILQQTGESLVQSIDPRLQVGLNAPIKPGMTTEEMLKRPAAETFEQIGPGKLLPEETRRAIGETGAKMSLAAQLRKQEAEAALAANPVDARPGSPEFYAGQAAGAVVEMAPLIAASIFVKNPAPLATYFGGRSLGSGFAEAQSAGAGPQDTASVGALYATAEALSEAIGGKILLEGGKTLVGSLVKGAVGEGLTEGLTEALQVLVDRGYLQPDMTAEDALNRIKDAAIVGAMAGGTIAPIVHATGGKDAEPPAPGPQTAVEPIKPEDSVAIEDQLALPAPEVMLALPPPEAPPEITRRQPEAPVTQEESIQRAEQEADFQAREALLRTRQAETAELLQTARETISPLGTFTTDELPGPAVQRVNTWRMQTGRSPDAPITIEEMARAKVPRTIIDAAISARRPRTEGQVLRPSDIRATAQAKNIIDTDANFKELAFRTTGGRDIDRMTQAQLKALQSTLDAMPAHERPVTMPVAETSPFSEGQYNKAVDALRNQGRYTLKAIKEVTGLTAEKDAQAVRDAMVRRGQLVQRSKNDYRLYDVLGTERQTTPADLPPGAFSEHVVKRLPVNKIGVKVNGKSVGQFASGTEARDRVRAERAKNPAAKIELDQAEDVAYGVMENRYDAQGNLLGQVVVDTARDEAAARALADQRNNPDSGSRYVQTTVEPGAAPVAAAPRQPKRRVAPAALEGRVDEVLTELNAVARQRGLPLLGTKVSVKGDLRAPDGTPVKGMHLRNLITLSAEYLSADMSTAQITDELAQVMDHELIHALKMAGILGPETEGWKTLANYARKAKRPNSRETFFEWAKRHYAGVPGYNSDVDIEEEAIAEAFRVWAANKRNIIGKPATVFRQLVEWFKRLVNAIPDDVFAAIETGDLVRDALTPPGSDQPRARAAEEMVAARAGAIEAQKAADENAVRVQSRQFLRARAQAREDRYGRSGPKTVTGTTPSRAYDTAELPPRVDVDALVDAYKAKAGLSTPALATYLPTDVDYLARVADAQQKATHDPKANDVAKAYRALINETRAMFDALGITEITRWTEDGAPYASPAEMLDDIAAGRLRMRLSDDMFGPGADNPDHPMNVASGRATTDSTPITNNDLFRVVHDVYGYQPNGLRSTPRDAYNAYHSHARLLSPEARRALATETLAQDSWHHFGPHLRRADGTVPRPSDVDYLPPSRKEFAEQKAFLLPEALVEVDAGWKLADDAAAAVEDVTQADLQDAPKFSVFEDEIPGGRLYGNPRRSPGGALSKPDTPSPSFTNERDGNRFFGGEMADEQLRRVVEGTDGATMIYITPDEFLAIADPTPNPEQAVYDAAIAEGFKFSTLPSLVVDGYAGVVRAPQSDGAFAARALAGQAEFIPVLLYPKRKENLGLVTALEANGMKVPWPAAGRQENFIELRGEEPKYSVNAAYGTRVPSTPPDTLNIIDQRVEGWVGRNLAAIGRSKRQLPIGKTLRGVVGDSIFDARIKLQDRMLSVKEMIENIQAMGGKIDDTTNVYVLEQLAGARTVHQVEHKERTLYEPLFAALDREAKAKDPISVKEFEDFLYARHAPERNTYLRSRGSKIANPSGMSDAEAAAILDKAALAGKTKRLEALADMASAISADTTRVRVENGLITQAAADASPYEFYVPLRGKTEEDLDPEDVYDPQIRARSGKGYTIGGREDRAVTGRERKAGDLLSHLLLQNTESVIRSEKNRVALSFMRLIQDNPQTGFGSILKTAPTRQVVGANGMIREAGDPSYRQRPDIFTAKYNGKEIIAVVNDPRVARAMKSDYATQSGAFVNALGRMNRYLATVNTSWNPEFLISNLARDMQTAGILGAQYDIKGLSGKIIRGAPVAAMGIREVLRDGTASTPMARAFKELQDAGGTTEFLGIHDLDTHTRRLRAMAAQSGWNPTARQAWERVKVIGRFIDDYNKVAENAFRLGAYVAAREAGASVDKAAFLAKNLTVNFNKGGENKSLMNSLYLFYNASISGTFVLLNGLKSKRVQKLVAGIVVAGIVQDMLNRVMSGDEDDNGVPDYDDIPDYVLETNWVFMIPGSKDYVSLPMPYGFNVFHNMGRNLSNAFSGSPVHSPGKSAMSTLMTALGAFNPMGGSQSVLNFIAPTFADPFVDIATNKDFAGNDIVPERPSFGVPVPDSQKYWSNTSDVPKWVAEQLNSLTGGNEVRSGAVDISPETLQFWFDYATGAAGKFATRNVELGDKVLKGSFEDIEIGDILFARRVVGSVTNRGNTERYYENATEVKTVAEEIKLAQEAGDAARFQSVLARSPAQVQLIKTFENGEKALSAMRKQIRELRATDAVPADRKADMIRALQEQQDSLMAMLNKTYFAAVNRGR